MSIVTVGKDTQGIILKSMVMIGKIVKAGKVVLGPRVVMIMGGTGRKKGAAKTMRFCYHPENKNGLSHYVFYILQIVLAPLLSLRLCVLIRNLASFSFLTCIFFSPVSRFVSILFIRF